MTPDEIGEILERQRWTFAKSMPRMPHSWTMWKDWTDEDQGLFRVVARGIREHGREELFHGRVYRYFIYNGWKYWHMDRSSEDTVLINRAQVSRGSKLEEPQS